MDKKADAREIAKDVWQPTIDGKDVCGRAGIVRHPTKEAAIRHAQAIQSYYGDSGFSK